MKRTRGLALLFALVALAEACFTSACAPAPTPPAFGASPSAAQGSGVVPIAATSAAGSAYASGLSAPASVPGAGSPRAGSPDDGGASQAQGGARTADGRGDEDPWSYIMPVDHGIRADRAGKGFFRAPRSHGEHNGIDFLAPVGTPILAACAGRATSGQMAGFGSYVKLVCPLPGAFGDGLYASLLYAHLSAQTVPPNPVEVARGQTLGASGKTGNAAPAVVTAHVHFELIVQPSEALALGEMHYGLDQSDNAGADRFFAALAARCLEPAGLKPRFGEIRRKRRADPFLALRCLVHDKPPLVAPPAPLDRAFVPWATAYEARDADFAAGLAPH